MELLFQKKELFKGMGNYFAVAMSLDVYPFFQKNGHGFVPIFGLSHSLSDRQWQESEHGNGRDHCCCQSQRGKEVAPLPEEDEPAADHGGNHDEDAKGKAELSDPISSGQMMHVPVSMGKMPD